MDCNSDIGLFRRLSIMPEARHQASHERMEQLREAIEQGWEDKAAARPSAPRLSV